MSRTLLPIANNHITMSAVTSRYTTSSRRITICSVDEELWVIHKVKVIADFLMHPCVWNLLKWAHAYGFSAICALQGDLETIISSCSIVKMKPSGSETIIIIIIIIISCRINGFDISVDGVRFLYPWRRAIRTTGQSGAHGTRCWYFHVCGLPEEPREAKGPHVRHHFPGPSWKRPASAGSPCWINNDNWILQCRDGHKVIKTETLMECSISTCLQISRWKWQQRHFCGNLFET